MLAVQVFGGLAVERDGAQCGGAAARRKTLALLALLAGAGRRGLSRDKLTAYLWPESDTEHGRGLLLQEAATVLGVRFRPQVSGELVAAETAAARAGEQGQECERLTARGGAAALRAGGGRAGEE